MAEIAENRPIEAQNTMLAHERDRGAWLRAHTLRSLRWVAICGQIATILFTEFFLGFDLPLLACCFTILAAAVFNIIATLTLAPNARLSERAATQWLVFDLVQLWVLLALTGGVSNPFCLLLLGPSTVAAATLGMRHSRHVIGAALAVIVLLELFHLPLKWDDGSEFNLVPEFQIGVGIALAIGISFIAVYVRRVADEASGMSRALAATQLALAREQRLSSLGAMAAAAGHELGTPLATIALSAREIERSLPEGDPNAEDVALIREQTSRCREILGSLALSARDAEHLSRAPLLSVVEEAAAPVERETVRIEYFVDDMPVGEHIPATLSVERRPELIHALRNILQNAIDFAKSEVWISIEQTPQQLSIQISDDGPGFSSDALSRAGEPFMTTRRRRRGGGDGYQGMGLGLFIAKTLLERYGASLSIANGKEGGGTLPGAVIEIIWHADAQESLIGQEE